MTTNSDRASAKIYTFPARGRFAASPREETKPTRNFISQAVRTAVGEAWYHDAAIEESAIKDEQQPRKH